MSASFFAAMRFPIRVASAPSVGAITETIFQEVRALN